MAGGENADCSKLTLHRHIYHRVRGVPPGSLCALARLRQYAGGGRDVRHPEATRTARDAHALGVLVALEQRGGELEQARGEAGAAVALLGEHGGGATQQRQREGGAAEAEEHRAVISRDLRVVRRQAVRAREERQRGGIVSAARGGERGEEVRLGVDVRVDVRARVWG